MRKHWLAVAALLFTAVAWGSTFTLIKNVLRSIAPEPFIFYRFTLAGILLVFVAASRGGLTRRVVKPAIALGVLVFLGYWLQTRGLLSISASRSAFLTGLYVVMVPFCDRMIYGARVSAQAWMGSLLAVVGTAVLIGGFDQRPGPGDLLTILCAAAFAVHLVLSARYTPAHSATALAAVQVLFVGIAAAPLSLFAPRTAATRDVVLVIVFTAVITTALAFVAMMWGQSHVSATEAAIILSFEPVAASIAAVVWDGEPVTTPFLCGAALILTAMILTQLQSNASATMRGDDAHSGHE
ncbi:MAG: DMT family transporter [Thermoanaerobaculia bacterium]|nr:DMT family transporter [Thermoanaerobaculia bacterium]